MKELEEKLSTLAKDLSSKEEALAAMQQKEIAAQRKLQLEEIGFEGEEAVATLEQFSELDDATFEQIIAVMKKRYSQQAEEKEEPKEAPVAQAEADEEVDTAEASEEVLEDAQESEEVAIAEAVGTDDPQDDLRAVASEWLGSVLQSVPTNE